MSLNVAQILAESALRHGDRTAIVLGELRISYEQLFTHTMRYAKVLQNNGVKPGDRVALLLPNTPHFPLAYYGALAAGAIVVPVHALLKADEIAFVLKDSGSSVLVCAAPLMESGAAGAAQVDVPVLAVMDGADPAFPRIDQIAFMTEPLDAIVPTEPSDPAVILYTSGTTGTPKGAVITHLNVMMNVDTAVLDSFAITKEDVVLGCLPMFHTFGQTCCLNVSMRVGASIVLMPRFDGPGALELLVKENCTIFMGVPTMYVALVAAAAAAGGKAETKLHSALSGGAALPGALLDQFTELFGVNIQEGYGLTETSPVVAFNQKHLPTKAGTVGTPIWGVEVGITKADLEDRIELLPTGEVGEIVVRGHNIFAGYLNNPEATEAAFTDGWFRTGDLGCKDDEGYLSIVDRKKEMILRGGYNVYPREVEEALLRHPAVAQAAVIAIPDEKYGEEVCAVIVLKADAEPLTGAELSAWAKEKIAAHKYPRVVHFVDSMPLGPSGKVLKRELIATLPSLV